MMEIPTEIAEAALKVARWMDENNHRNWCLLGVCSRRFADAVQYEMPHLKKLHPEQASDHLTLLEIQRHNSAVNKLRHMAHLEPE